MPPRVDFTKCDGCKAQDEPLCEQVCPGDLMTLGENGKAICRETSDCWDCMSCTKICPVGAIETNPSTKVTSTGLLLGETPSVTSGIVTAFPLEISRAASALAEICPAVDEVNSKLHSPPEVVPWYVFSRAIWPPFGSSGSST